MNGLWLGLNWLTWLTRYLVRDDSVNDDEDEGYDYPQLEVEVSVQADMKFWYIEP